MRKSYYVLIALVLFWASCSKDTKDVELVKTDKSISQKLMTPDQINAFIEKEIEFTGNFEWTKAPDIVLWSAIYHGNNIITIGFGKSEYSTGKDASVIKIKNEIIDFVAKTESELSGKKISATDISLFDGEILNYIDLKIENMETLQKVRSLNNIRYIEPSGYEFFAYSSSYKSDSGCDKTSDVINTADYTTVAPNCLVSWTYTKHNIPSAWNYSTGAGITVGLVDTGVSPDQPLLGSEFNDGYSSGRTIQKYGVFVDSWWPWSTTTDGPSDKCGHGTLMAATISSPRNNNYMATGVAYNCNLVAYRATGDVVLDGYHEQNGVATALKALGNRTDVKIISMSIGHIISIGKISDAVKYAYSKGKLIFAAGGTSTNFTNWTGVIFPAWMAECVAVTGIEDGAGYTECDVCHKGSKIDFAVIMQRANDANRTSVTLGFYANEKSYVGGSSVATATTAGIAALVWARHPTWTRSQILDKMKQSASLYPNRDSNFGYGYIDALEAVL